MPATGKEQRMEWLLLSFVGLYGLVILRRRQAWQQLPLVELPPAAAGEQQVFVSVIIPVRNEEATIEDLLRDLAGQHYPAHLFEVLVVDDGSTDQTAARVQAYRPAAPYALRYLDLRQVGLATGKKQAVTAGVQQARGELLAFTDGDCRVQPGWLQHLAFSYCRHQARFISGPVAFQHAAGAFARMQVVEFASLIGVGAASLAMGKPNMCNGANLAYPRQVFEEVQGFAGNDHIASGDDEFLMHKVFAKYPDRVVFLKAPAATVFTRPQPSLASFVAQRVRWASKWPAYQHAAPKLLALLVFGVNLLLLAGLGLWAGGMLPAWAFGLAFGLKFGVDMLFLWPVMTFFKQQQYWPYIFLLQLVYVPYVVGVGLASWKSQYRWKGRVVRTGCWLLVVGCW
jgi:poly-beta-1,6-N-acetyl-D-glucosamine synthase